ncbi:Rdx family-domain-containing protein [Trichophaea hybrida]|nr:Rdx family-domain-containing protein [Trichophaea hybrida]
MDNIVYPRVTIQYCTQCKWLLRISCPIKFAQELLSTFSTSLGEVSLIPSTGGTFVVQIYHQNTAAANGVQTTTLWDRKVDGGFPETKQLKQRVRDVIDPGRNLGHVDSKKAIETNAGGLATSSLVAEKPKVVSESAPTCSPRGAEGEVCEDCQ